MRRYKRISVENRRLRCNGDQLTKNYRKGRRGRSHQPFFFSKN